MVRRCAWGTCNSDERYPDRMQGYKFIPFPKPKAKKNLDKCLRWIKACGRPHDQLNVNRINKHKAVCSKHFVGENGPTDEFPDPVQADGSISKPSRKRTTRYSPQKQNKRKRLDFTAEEYINENISFMEVETGTSTQTDEQWISPMDLLATTVEIQQLRQENDEKNAKIIELQDTLKKLATENENLKEELNENRVSKFSVKSVLEKESKIKGLFKYYTAIEHDRFKTLLQFLLPESFTLEYEKGRADIKKLLQEDCLFLTLIRLRHNFGLKHIAMRFDLTVQSASSIFNTWVDHIYLKFGQLSIWPHRDTIIENMPKDFKSDFPNTLIIIDGTEIKTQTPRALGLQSQLYSAYKGNTTLKALM